MGNKRPPFEPGTIFHVYNHGNAEDNIFRDEENYRYFLKRYSHYLYPVVKTYAFCLLPNHFHLMVEVRSVGQLKKFYQEKYPDKDPQSFRNFADLVSNQFKNFLISYSKSFNKKYNRRGSLFLDNIKRKPITDKTYYSNLITYIHLNPVHHGFVEKPSEWMYSSYQIIISRKQTKLYRKEILDLFGDRKAFVEEHKKKKEINREELF